VSADTWTTRLPGGWKGRALAAGTGLFGIIVVWAMVVQPLMAFYQDRANTLERQKLLRDHMEAAADSLPALAAISDRPTRPAVALLTGASDAVAAASLQQIIQHIATNAGTSLTAVETLPAELKGQWHKIPLRITLSAPWPVLMQVLRGVELAPVQIVMDDVHFHSAALQAHSVTIPIQASFVVSGFRLAN
jgi:general secretion pathway protein M